MLFFEIYLKFLVLYLEFFPSRVSKHFYGVFLPFFRVFFKVC